jgi:hypothetical protein
MRFAGHSQFEERPVERVTALRHDRRIGRHADRGAERQIIGEQVFLVRGSQLELGVGQRTD